MSEIQKKNQWEDFVELNYDKTLSIKIEGWIWTINANINDTVITENIMKYSNGKHVSISIILYNLCLYYYYWIIQ